jgi:ATP-binding cassette subfamily F protein 3
MIACRAAAAPSAPRAVSLFLAHDLKKRYGAHEVLRGATFRIDAGEKLGLVGRNGSGKTTLLRLIEGVEKPDGGRAGLRKGARLGHVPQVPSFVPGESARAYVEGGLREAREVAARLEHTAERMAAAASVELDSLVREHGELGERLERLGGWEAERRVETVLSGIGLAPSLWDREARTLSGGEKSRTALARELVAGHDLLLLDEPTNHLDLAGIEWLEAWLAAQASAVLIVSHDRRLLDTAVGAILELERGTVRRYRGGWSHYLHQKEERFAAELRAWEQQQDEIQREEAFIRKHMGSQRTAEARGRRKRLDSLARLERPYNDLRRPAIAPPRAAGGGELVLEARGLAGGYGDRAVFSGLDLRVGRGQRIGIVGANGSGKSTLLRVLAGELAPLAGVLERGHGARCGYYDQESARLDASGTPFSILRADHPSRTDLELRSHLARFLFRGDEIEKPVSALSGGERARLSLARLLLEPVTWLALDEPTNHLDLPARTALEEALGGFDGALLCVSHDRALLDGLCTHLLVVREGRVSPFAGNYSAWREARSRQSEREPPADRAKPAPRPAPGTAARAGRIRNPFLFEKLEQRIIDLETELASLHEQSATETVYRDPDRLRALQSRLREIEDDLARANAEWEAWIS